MRHLIHTGHFRRMVLPEAFLALLRANPHEKRATLCQIRLFPRIVHQLRRSRPDNSRGASKERGGLCRLVLLCQCDGEVPQGYGDPGVHGFAL